MENKNKDSFDSIDPGNFTVADYPVCFKRRDMTSHPFDLSMTLRTALGTDASKSEISCATTEQR